MKLFNFVVILLVIFLAFCTNKEKEPEVPPVAISDKDTVLATLEHNLVKWPEAPFRIDSVVVGKKKKKNHLRFVNNTAYNATFAIPNSDKLFEKYYGHDTLTVVTVGNVKYLFIPVPAHDRSEKFKINKNANPDTINAAIYPFSAFCKNGTVAAERKSSPIIIVDPDI